MIINYFVISKRNTLIFYSCTDKPFQRKYFWWYQRVQKEEKNLINKSSKTLHFSSVYHKYPDYWYNNKGLIISNTYTYCSCSTDTKIISSLDSLSSRTTSHGTTLFHVDVTPCKLTFISREKGSSITMKMVP